MRSARRWIVGGVLLLAVGVIEVGCASTPKPAPASSPTGGISLIYARRVLDEQRFERYELDADGTLRIGGGKAALLGNTEWSGTPNPEDLEAILSAIRSADLLETKPSCTPVEVDGRESIRTEIEVRDATVRRKYSLKGECPTLAPLRQALDHAGRDRFRSVLDALPEPGVRTKP